MTGRAERKRTSRDRILDAAGRRLRAEGLGGAGIAAVMADAGLTHGAFYAHFRNKDDLTRAALEHALRDNRPLWMGRPRTEPWPRRLTRLARRYLTPAHRRDREAGCALAALCSDAARADAPFREAFEAELLKSAAAIQGQPGEAADPRRTDETLAFLALVIGTLTLSRAVASPALSDRLLLAGRAAAETLASPEAPS